MVSQNFLVNMLMKSQRNKIRALANADVSPLCPPDRPIFTTAALTVLSFQGLSLATRVHYTRRATGWKYWEINALESSL